MKFQALTTLSLSALIFSLTATSNAQNPSVTFVPPAENEVPPAATTGNAATRNGTFVPPAENEVPPAATTGSAATRETFMPPADSEVPPAATTSGASTRNDRCQANDTSRLRALLPQQHNYGATLQERPTFFVHLPETNVPQAFFSLKEAAPGTEERTIYTTTVPITPNRTGILQWQLPADAPALEMGRDYRWYFVLQCGDRIQTGDVYVDGWVRRIQPPDNVAEIAATDSWEAAVAYGRAGIWYDLISVLAARRRAQPNDAVTLARWEELLASDTVGLEQLSGAPLLARP